MSGVQLLPLEGGEPVKVPTTKITIGRGPFLQVVDKRVSRNHAVLELSEDGKLVMTPIHSNPCFLSDEENMDHVPLPKDKARILKHNDVFSLLPDKLHFKVIYLDQLNKSDKKSFGLEGEDDTGEKDGKVSPKAVAPKTEAPNKKGIMEGEATPTKKDTTTKKEVAVKKEAPPKKDMPTKKDTPTKKVVATKKEIPTKKQTPTKKEVPSPLKNTSLPVDKERTLPGWMMGAAARLAGSPAKAKVKAAPAPQTKATNARPGRATAVKKKYTEDDNDYFSAEEESLPAPMRKVPSRTPPKQAQPCKKPAISDMKEEEKQMKPSKKAVSSDELEEGKQVKTSKKTASGDEMEEEEWSEEEKQMPKPLRKGGTGQGHRPRRAAIKTSRYSGSVILSGDDLDELGFESSEDEVGRGSPDSDFIAEEEDSGSDWEATERKSARKRPAQGTRRSTRVRRNADSEDFSSSEEYKPRASRRKATAHSKQRAECEDEDDWSDEEMKKPKRGGQQHISPNGRGKKGGRSHKESSSEEEESEEERPKLKIVPKKRSQPSDEDDDLSEVEVKKKRTPAKETKKGNLNKKLKKGVSEELEEGEVQPKQKAIKKISRPSDDDDEDFSEEEKVKHQNSSKKIKKAASEESEELEKGEIRPKRKATQKISQPSYSDDDEDFSEDEKVKHPNTSKKPKMVASDESGELEEGEVRPKRKATQKRSQPSDDDDEDFSEEEVKKKGTPASKTKKLKLSKKSEKSESEDEDDDDSDGVAQTSGGPRRSCFYGESCYRKNPLHFEEFCHPGDSSYDEEECSVDKKQINFKKGDSNGDKKDENNTDNKPVMKNLNRNVNKKDTKNAKKELREKDKQSILHGESDDEGEKNTYDYDDSFIDNTTETPGETVQSSQDDTSDGEANGKEVEEGDIKERMKEAKGFMKNKKLQKPATNPS